MANKFDQGRLAKSFKNSHLRPRLVEIWSLFVFGHYLDAQCGSY